MEFLISTVMSAIDALPAPLRALCWFTVGFSSGFAAWGLPSLIMVMLGKWCALDALTGAVYCGVLTGLGVALAPSPLH